MSSVTDLLRAKARRPERTVHVCVAADLVDRHRKLSAELAELASSQTEGSGKRRLGERAGVKEKAAEIVALEADMADASIEVRMRALIPAEWRQWKVDNQPREDVPFDERWGVNTEALITQLTRRCIIEPEFDDEAWALWLADVASQEQEKVAMAAFLLHEEGVDIPKSPLASLVMAESDDA